MRLASLTLQGFKSFADRTTLEFTEGVTAIVGPNGSGKSNLIDALRWASGGGRASEFRAGDKRELIFHGSAGKRSLGFAEVQLSLEHGGRTLSISRTLTRDGESKLKVGGRTARFLDLEDELSGSGLGRGGLAVIGQGEVSEVLMADPPKLLSYVAESVGVAKLSARRESTLSGLAQAQAHLTRLEDIRQALEERVEALGLEAAQAERAAELGRERLRLRFTLSSRRVASLQQEIAGLRERGASLETALLEGREALAEAQDARRTTKAQLAEAEAHYRQYVAATEVRRGDVRVAQEQLRAAGAQHTAYLHEAVRLDDEIKALLALTPPTPPEGDEAAGQARLTAAETRVHELQGLLAESVAEVQAQADALEAFRRAEAEAAQALARYTSSREALTAQLADVTKQQASSAVPTNLAKVAHELEQAESTLRDVHEALETAQELLAQVQQDHAAAFAEAQARAQAAARQRAAFEARRGYAQGPRSALTSGIAGVIGSVADLITVPSGYRQAVSSALGRRAEHVVVDSSEVAQQVLAHVRRAGGWVTLLPLDLIRPRPPSLATTLEAEPGIIALVSEVVGSDARFRPLVVQLLGTTALVTELSEAVALAQQHRSRPRLVTLAGEVLESYGAISGGRSQSAGLVLGAAAELEEAETAATTAQARASELTDVLQTRQAEARALRTVLSQAQAQQQRAARVLAEAREAAAARASLRTELERRQGQLNAAMAELVSPEQAELPDLAPLQATLLDVQARQEALRRELGGAQQTEAAARSALALWRERQRSFALEQHRFSEAQARLGSLREQLESTHSETAQAAQKLVTAEAALSAAEAALPTDESREAARYREVQQAEVAAEEALEQRTHEQAARSGELEALNLTLARREAALEHAEAEHRAFPEGLETLPGSLKGLRDRLNDAEAELEVLGPVNHRAAHELAAQRERLGDLSTQLRDVEQAAAELKAVLGDLDESVQVRLVAGTKALATGFAHYAEKLFGAGARASVELTWEDGRPYGLKLGLQPPTKQTKALSLLSVGERTMGALAFLFALMASDESSGLPLAILDEVDAPLDEANIRRFCTFLDELSQRGTQFILITHQKATMEVAMALWGVTTEGGVSRVFSIRREAHA